MSTAYHAKYFACELSRIGGAGVERLSRSLFDACVDLNPHQIEAALFAFRSPICQGVLPADDLVETFNYVTGLRVKTMDDVRGVRVVTGTNPQGQRVLILWRRTREPDNDALDAWFRKQGYHTKEQEFDVICVNGDNNLENLRKPDQTWRCGSSRRNSGGSCSTWGTRRGRRHANGRHS